MDRSEQLLGSVQHENRRLADPLKKAREQLQELQRQLGTQEKEKGERIVSELHVLQLTIILLLRSVVVGEGRAQGGKEGGGRTQVRSGFSHFFFATDDYSKKYIEQVGAGGAAAEARHSCW